MRCSRPPFVSTLIAALFMMVALPFSLAMPGSSEESEATEEGENTLSKAESSSQVTAEPEAAEGSDYGAEKESGARPYVFGWMDYPDGPLKVRGGTSRGAPVELLKVATEDWERLQDPSLSPLFCRGADNKHLSTGCGGSIGDPL